MLEPAAVSALLLFAAYHGFGAREVHEQSSFLCGRVGRELFPEALAIHDDAANDVWGCWEATWRDVRILDGANQLVGVYNLTEHNLSEEANQAELEAMLIAAAGG